MSKTKIPANKRMQVLNRDGNKCLWCGNSAVDGVKLHVDHIISEHFGGSSDFDNLGTLCDSCNLGKGQEYRGNYLLSTILKVPNIWDRIKILTVDDPGIGTEYRLFLTFYKSDGRGYQQDKIFHSYIIDDVFLISKSDSSDICVNELKEKGLLEFKDKVKNLLFENHGFFKLVGDKLVFKEFDSSQS